jgi:uncharacterized membrane protein
MVLRFRHILFWLVTAAVMGLATHVAYALFMPGRNFAGAIDDAVEGASGNQFKILTPDVQQSFVPFAASNDIVGVCKFDVSQGPFKVTAGLPRGYWSFAVYTTRGRQVYAINDTQADTNSLTVELRRNDGLIASIFGGDAEPEDIVGDSVGYRISVIEKEGIALLWMAVADPLLRKEAEDVMNKSRCFKSE